ncbi:MAG: reverse transcriptase domain-containing protein [Candidatus Micrarchaeaceae archaeon]
MLAHTYQDIISLENLFAAWQEFLEGKTKRTDVQEFQEHLMRNILILHHELLNKTYRHSKYEAFKISDPKPRDIHKSAVRDRLLHHAIYRVLYPYFDKRFITDSYSCRVGKGTHRALNRFQSFARKVSLNHTKTVWVLKCDIKKFFASVDHEVLLGIVAKHIGDADVRNLLSEIVGSFYSGRIGTGLPLGNLTSQLLVNVYMNEFDQYVKRRLKAKHYIRYGDDFVILSRDREWLKQLLPHIQDFLWNELRLTLHPQKVSISTVASGVDFLGWVHFPDHRVLRTATKKRMLRRVERLEEEDPTVQSYLGLLSHGNTYKRQQELKRRLR